MKLHYKQKTATKIKGGVLIRKIFDSENGVLQIEGGGGDEQFGEHKLLEAHC